MDSALGRSRRSGGGEEFLRQEREWGPEAWEKYRAEEVKRQKAERAK